MHPNPTSSPNRPILIGLLLAIAFLALAFELSRGQSLSTQAKYVHSEASTPNDQSRLQDSAPLSPLSLVPKVGAPLQNHHPRPDQAAHVAPAVRAFLDPKTGLPQSPPPDVAEQRPQNAPAGPPGDWLEESQGTTPAGGVKLNLRGRWRQHIRASTISSDAHTLACQPGPALVTPPTQP